MHQLDNRAELSIFKKHLMARATADENLRHEIPQSPKEIHFSESVEDLNRIYSQSKNREFGFPAVLEVDLTYYRSGQDIFFHGRFDAEFGGCCGRCLETYNFALDKHFDFVLTRGLVKSERGAEELTRDDLGLSSIRRMKSIWRP